MELQTPERRIINSCVRAIINARLDLATRRLMAVADDPLPGELLSEVTDALRVNTEASLTGVSR